MPGKGTLLPEQHLQCCVPCLFPPSLLWALASVTSSVAVEEHLGLDDLIKALLLGNVHWGLSYSRNFGEHEHNLMLPYGHSVCDFRHPRDSLKR